MANEIEEIRYQVGEAWKGEYNASTPYGVAAVVQDPTGLSVYRSLKNGNTGHPLTDTNWWFCIIDMSSIKAASDEVGTLNTQVSAAETARVTAENNRVTAESGRVTAESGRVTAESSRVSAESSRVTAESGRVSSENARATAESSRATAESGRVSAEQSRVLAENLRDNAESGRATAETNRASAEAERHTQYTADHTTATSDHTIAASDHTTAVADHTQASEDHSASVTATTEANNVNAELDGLTITITDRDGQSHSVNIGFDIAGTYASVSAMNADAANVQEGAFVMIATSDTTSTENARLYVRNSTAPTSSEPFTFLSDLDQASSSAWADWMENYKPTIIADHQRAETDHTTASTDHTTAASDHTAATSDHTQAASDHSTATSDHTAAASDHTRAESDHTTAAADHTQAESDHSRAETDHNTIESRFVKNETDIENLEENKANKDGYYSQMTVGSAENLVGQTVDSDAYLIRPTGGAENEVANGVASVLGMEGNSAVWNQLLNAPDGGTVSGPTTVHYGSLCNIGQSKAIVGHKYYLSVYIDRQVTSTNNFGIYFGGSTGTAAGNLGIPILSSTPNNSVVSAVRECNGIPSKNSITFNIGSDSGGLAEGDYITITNPMMIDLTLLGIDNLTTTAEVEAWLAQHVGTKPYYAYNAGTILSAQTLGIKTYGQNLLNPTTRQAKLIPYTWVENDTTYSNQYTIKNVPSGATATFTPDATGVAESVTITDDMFDITSYGSGILELSAANADTYVCIKWNEQKDDDIVPFVDYINDFDVRKVYGKAAGSETRVQCYPNGMRSAGSVHDILTASEAVVKIGSVDLGTLNWTKHSSGFFYSNQINTVIPQTAAAFPKIRNAKYITWNNYDISNGIIDKAISIGRSGVSYTSCVTIRDSAYTDATIFKTAMNGVILNYELATPITYTDLIYRDGGIDRPLADVLMNIDVNNWSMEEQLMTPYDNGNPTSIPAKITTQYGMDAVEEIDTIKHTHVSAYSEQNFSDSQKAQARRNIGAVEEDGSYPNMSVGIAKNLAGENAVEAEYNYRQSGGTTGTDTGIANVTTIKGESLKWKQMIRNGNFSNGTTSWRIRQSDGGSVSGGVLSLIKKTTGEVDNSATQTLTTSTISGHKYYLSAEVVSKSSTDAVYFLFSESVNLGNPKQYTLYAGLGTIITTKTHCSTIITADGSYAYYGFYCPFSDIEIDSTGLSLTNIMLFDLTEMGLDSITDPEEFEALYPLAYYNYNAGTLINNNASAIVTTGFNQFNKDTVTSTSYIDDNGVLQTNNGRCVSDYIPVFPNTDYYFSISISGSAGMNHAWYDASKNLISVFRSYGANNTIVTSPSNARYLRCSIRDTYVNSFIVNLSWSGRNGEYEPYEKHTFYFDKVLQSSGSLATVTGKLNGEGESVTVFPDGLKSAGNVFDEIKGNVAIKRIGSRAYTSGDESDATVITDGTNTYYALATPETYILDQTVTGGYQVNARGTEQRLPEDTASAVNAPVSYSVIYPIDAVGTITKLPVNYISEGSLTNFTTELASKLGTFLSATIGVTATYNQTTQEYDYTITITSNE